jgi:hypothetical protein
MADPFCAVALYVARAVVQVAVVWRWHLVVHIEAGEDEIPETAAAQYLIVSAGAADTFVLWAVNPKHRPQTLGDDAHVHFEKFARSPTDISEASGEAERWFWKRDESESSQP